MTTPERDENQGFNEPKLLEAEGYLNRALRRLGEGLGPYVYGKIHDRELMADSEKGIVTRDLSIIFGKMEVPRNWNRLGLGPDEWNYLGLLIGFRNGPWAHMAGYSDDDVHDCLGYIRKFLRAVSADEQAQAVEQMWSELGKLIFSQSTPERPRDSEIAELWQHISDMESYLKGQLEGFRSAPSLMVFAPAGVAPIAPPVFPAIDDGAPSEACPIASDTAEDFLRRGDADRREGYIDDALTNYNRAIELNPRLVEAYIGLGNAYMDGEEYEFAIANYDDALRLNHGDAVVYFYRGSAYAALGDHDRAIDDYSEAMRLNPEDSNTYLFRGLYYLSRGSNHGAKKDYDLAILDFERGSELAPDDKSFLEFREAAIRRRDRAFEYDQDIEEKPDDAKRWHLRGLYYLDGENYDRAIADFTEAITRGGDNADAAVWNDRGWAYWQQGKDDLAYDDYSQAIALNRDYAAAHYNRAWVWRRRGNHGNAIIDFSQAIAIKPDYAAAYQHRGISYFDTGQRDLAQTDFETARGLGFRP